MAASCAWSKSGQKRSKRAGQVPKLVALDRLLRLVKWRSKVVESGQRWSKTSRPGRQTGSPWPPPAPGQMAVKRWCKRRSTSWSKVAEIRHSWCKWSKRLVKSGPCGQKRSERPNAVESGGPRWPKQQAGGGPDAPPQPPAAASRGEANRPKWFLTTQKWF